MKRLLDKRIVIIGAGSCGKGVGNGKAMAILFAEQGGKVLCIDSDPKAAQETVEDILKSGGDAFKQIHDGTCVAPKIILLP